MGKRDTKGAFKTPSTSTQQVLLNSILKTCQTSLCCDTVVCKAASAHMRSHEACDVSLVPQDHCSALWAAPCLYCCYADCEVTDM